MRLRSANVPSSVGVRSVQSRCRIPLSHAGFLRRLLAAVGPFVFVGAFADVRLLLVTAAPLPQADRFLPGCTIPYAGIATHQAVDAECSADGLGMPNDVAQNRRKNNVCATGAPVTVTIKSFRSLQAKVDHLTGFPWGSNSTLPSEVQRAKLRDIYTTSDNDTIGEGSVVRFVAFMMHGKHSNTGAGNGEQVNCKGESPEDNDIHLYLSWIRNEVRDCNSVTAEIIPHFRPGKWLVLSELYSDKKTHAWTKIVQANLDRPLRFTGHLMFDANHRPCSPGQADKNAHPPRRMSAWEIHPVYGIDVCSAGKTRSACPADDDSAWRPLDQWGSR